MIKIRVFELIIDYTIGKYTSKSTWVEDKICNKCKSKSNNA